MDLEKRYEDSKGNKRSIVEMINCEPEWACNRIQVGEKAIEKLAAFKPVARKESYTVTQILDACENYLENVDQANAIIHELRKRP